MADQRYLLSFTAGGLLIPESSTVIDVFFDEGDWQGAWGVIERQNLLQSRTTSTLKRKFREVRSRLSLLTAVQRDLLHDGSVEDQLAILWLAACKRYQFLSDFAKEVVHAKFSTLDYQLTTSDLDEFVNLQLLWHEELEQISTSTLAKIKTVTLRMLREAGIVDEGLMIQPAFMSMALRQAIEHDDPAWFQIFPVAPSEAMPA